MAAFRYYTASVLRTAASTLTKSPRNSFFRSMASDVKKDYNVGTDPTSRLIWVDLELTGLNLEQDRILEAACVITDANLEIIASSPELIIHQPDEILDKMGPWCQETHRRTGLYDAVRKSTLTTEKAEEILLEFVRKHTESRTCPLAGNTVYMDRFFLMKYMPKFDEHIHYRIVDVSSIKEACRRWTRDLYAKAPDKSFQHRASGDIHESIEELKYYKKCIFDPKSS